MLASASLRALHRYRQLSDPNLPDFIYLDTSLLVLIGTPDDSLRQEVAGFFDRLLKHRTNVVVNNLILLES